MGLPNDTADWGPIRRVLFRFLFLYLIIYNLSGFYGTFLGAPDQKVWDVVVPWVGQQLFALTITVRPNGSGDTTYNYVQVFCFAVISILAALLWTLLDRKRRAYPRLAAGLRVYVRYALASAMILYGSVKLIKSQFPSPSLDRLLEPFGDASPMGLLWTFMGASVGYNVFAGAGEFLGGLFLTTRRTTLLGALLSAGVLSNVVMLNFCYDVPVKLFSAHLLAMAVYLMAPDLCRLANLFLFNQPVPPAVIRPWFSKAWLNYGLVAVRTVCVVGLTGLALQGAYRSRAQYGDGAPRSPLYGIWNVEEFEVDGQVKPLVLTDTSRWQRVIFDYPGFLALQSMNQPAQRYALDLDGDKKTLNLTKRDQADWKAALSYQQPEADRLLLQGTFDGKKIKASLRRTDPKDFLLVNRGFHWINEYPFNR